ADGVGAGVAAGQVQRVGLPVLDDRVAAQGQRGVDVVDGDGRRVIGDAAVLVEDAAVDGVTAVVGVEEARPRAGAGAGVVGGQAGGVLGDGVVQAGGVVRRRLVDVRERDRGRAALVDGAVGGEVGGWRLVVHVERHRLGGDDVTVIVADLDPDVVRR